MDAEAVRGSRWGFDERRDEFVDLGWSVKREAFGHAKFRLVARDLKIPVFAAYGLMESIWNTASLRFPRGDIGRLSNEEIAAEIEGYDEDADELVNVLVARRLLDRDDEHRLIVHDWPQHADDTVHWKLARAGQTFADGTPSKRAKPAKSSDSNGSRQRESAAVEHQPTPLDGVGQSQTPSEFDGLPSPSPSPSHDVETTCSSDSTVGAVGADDTDEDGVETGLRAADQAGYLAGDVPIGAEPPAAESSARSRTKPDPRGTRIPEDFALTPTRSERALLLGLPPDMLQDTFDEFVAYWRSLPGKAARKLNWDLTWDNNCRRVVQVVRVRRGPPTASPSRAPSERRGPSHPPRGGFLNVAEKNEAAIADFEEMTNGR